MRLIPIILLPLCCLPFTQAEEITLGAGGKITGTIESVSEDQQITIKSALSPQPITILGKSFSGVTFDRQDSAEKNSAPNLLQLKNGDSLPITIKKLEDQTLSFSTQWAEQLSIERSQIDALYFGTAQNLSLYSGPKDKEWQLNNSWKFEDGLVSSGYGAATRKFEKLPERYIIRFHISWVGMAGFKFIFANSSDKTTEVTDCYYLQFNNAGLELKRQASGGKKHTSLAVFNDFTPEQLDDNEMLVEIRVDRSNRQLQLSVNGKELRKNIVDPLETGATPSGEFMSFLCTSGNNDKHTIDEITVSSWDSNSSDAHLEKRTDAKNDILFDLESNRSSGVLKSITAGDKEPQILFENPHDPSPHPLSASQVAIIYFSGEASSEKKAPYRIELLNDCLLQVDSFRISAGKLTVKHPLLGELEIPTSLVTKIAPQS